MVFLSPTILIASTGVFSIIYVLGKCIYNLCFHPLAKYPGPRLAAISNAWYCKNWIGGRYVYEIDDIHKKYGDVVRIGPNMLSFGSAQSWQDIYGHAGKRQGQFLKSTWYDRGDQEPDIASEKDPAKHREIRKQLAHAFSAKALRDQTEVVLNYVDLFVSQIEKYGTQEKGINMDEWFMWVTFDIIGDLAFGDSFHAVAQAKSHFWVDMIVDSSYAGQLDDVFRRLPLLVPLAPFLIPRKLFADRKKFLKLTKDRVLARMKRPNDRDDFFSHLLSDKASNISVPFLQTQASTLIVAGSDTTANFLTGVTYYLTTHPLQMSRLQKEVRETFKASSEIDSVSTQSLPYLFAVVEEGLRIFPSAPFGLQRFSPGADVDGNYVPAGTIVSTAPWTVSHDPRYYHDPEHFHPERWMPKDHPYFRPEFATDQLDAAKPFSTGPRACIGINLAYMDMRVILTKLMWHFDMELVNKHEIDWRRDTNLQLLWKKPKVMVKFTPVVR